MIWPTGEKKKEKHTLYSLTRGNLYTKKAHTIFKTIVTIYIAYTYIDMGYTPSVLLHK